MTRRRSLGCGPASWPSRRGTSGWNDDDRSSVTDATGHFEVARAPVGKAYVALSPLDWEGADYEMGFAVLTIVPGINELPPIALVKKRVKPPAQAGDLGSR